MIAVIDIGAPLPWWAILCGCALLVACAWTDAGRADS